MRGGFGKPSRELYAPSKPATSILHWSLYVYNLLGYFMVYLYQLLSFVFSETQNIYVSFLSVLKLQMPQEVNLFIVENQDPFILYS